MFKFLNRQGNLYVPDLLLFSSVWSPLFDFNAQGLAVVPPFPEGGALANVISPFMVFPAAWKPPPPPDSQHPVSVLAPFPLLVPAGKIQCPCQHPYGLNSLLTPKERFICNVQIK